MSTPTVLLGRVIEAVMLTPTIRELHLELTEPRELTFRAGQFIQILIAPRVMRQYSIVSSPSETKVLTLCADLSPGGEGSKYIMSLSIGEPVRFRGPFGVFVLPDRPPQPVEFVATGAGIAPIHSMILHALTHTPAVPLHLLFGNRSQEYILYHEEFQELAASYPHFQYVPTLSRPTEGWTGTTGRVTEVLTQRGDLSHRSFYLCGSPVMVDDVRKVLVKKGVAEQDIHFEKFF